MGSVTINCDLNTPCAECGKGGATQNGLCLKCVARALGTKPMRSVNARVVRDRAIAMREKWKRG